MSTNPYQDDARLIELLERWQSGNFTRADEQELLILADSDEFRRDVVEGFWSQPEAEHALHLASLKTRLNKRRQAEPIRGIMMRWMAAAAALALIALAVVWLIPQPNVQQETFSAQHKLGEAAEETPIAAHLPDSATHSDDQAQPPVASNTERIQESPAPDRIATVPVRPAKPSASTPTPGAEANPSILTQPVVASTPEVPLETSSKQVETISEAEAEEFAAATDELKDVDQGYGNSAKRVQEKKAPIEARKKKSTAPASPSEPSGGWKAFEDYLRQNARLPETARQNNISGTLRMQFRLNELNQPFDFKPVKALGFGCEEAAIRLIQAYSWQRGGSDSLVVDIPFIR